MVMFPYKMLPEQVYSQIVLQSSIFPAKEEGKTRKIIFVYVRKPAQITILSVPNTVNFRHHFK